MKYRVLVAEDEPLERRVLCGTLNRYLGDLITIREARNGPEALALIREELPQVAVLDIEMPGVSGLEVARKLRARSRSCGILFLSGVDNFAYARQAISLRAQDYLLKPCDERELVFGVEQAIRQCTALDLPLPADPAEPPPVSRPEEEDRRMARVRQEVIAFLRGHYQQDISMQDAAAALGYSESYFCKRFKACFQMNFSAYLNQYRVRKALQLMEDPRLSLREVSRACGYRDPNYFARVFKRITGQTPSEYRLSRE